MIGSYERAKQYLGQPVFIESEGKIYCGLVREVTVKGVRLEPIDLTQQLHRFGHTMQSDIKTADRPENMKLELSQFGFGFRPFFPFFSPFRFQPFFNPFFFRPFRPFRPFFF